ncbi:MAG: MarR family winged helix-turn-helix transcriptional regulator [Thermoflexibacteraceae bacterium]|jgi:DNA-binding MarR family transcriptional regulator
MKTTNTIEGLLIDNQLCFPLYALSRKVTQLYQPYLQELDLTYPQYLIMMFLWETPKATVGEIGEKLHLDTGTLTPLLKRMEQKGLLHRQRATEDERKVWVVISNEGEKMLEQAKDIPQKMFCALQLSPNEFEGLRNALQTMLKQLG